jgi:putative DNA primase/helicase
MVGPLRCGKGTIGRVQTAMLGRNSVGGPTMSNLSETFGLESLITKPAAIISDARIGARTDKSTIVERLLSISGEDSLDVPRKYMIAWTGKLPTRFTILTNELPSLSDGSGALAGRFIILIMTKSFFGKEDPALTSKLLTELPGILNWSIEGYPPPQVLQIVGRLYHLVLAFPYVGDIANGRAPSGSLRTPCGSCIRAVTVIPVLGDATGLRGVGNQ